MYKEAVGNTNNHQRLGHRHAISSPQKSPYQQERNVIPLCCWGQNPGCQHQNKVNGQVKMQPLCCPHQALNSLPTFLLTDHSR
ncbi:hypothetical protein DPMN_014669 [Dreissena polymorpha]|uniref:Uncharacterized protein n=1 Tax=Dreissena polymorpha TaxID=45954 RepID=A0A9D4NBD9_DREPO|nr:hypothetical protein DPMN_014669 [Dreissena polymorpha]